METFSRALSVVVPVYNGASTVSPLVERVAAVLDGTDYEILLVNDGSDDASWERIEGAAALHPRVRGIDLMRNYGQHNALLAGIRAADGAIIVTIDDDLQNPPEEIPKLLAELDRGNDVIYGTTSHEHYGLWRGLATRLTKVALRGAVGNEIAAKVSAFRMLDGASRRLRRLRGSARVDRRPAQLGRAPLQLGAGRAPRARKAGRRTRSAGLQRTGSTCSPGSVRARCGSRA